MTQVVLMPAEHLQVLVIRTLFVVRSLNAQSCSGLSLAEREIKGISSACLCGDMTHVHEEMHGWHLVTS